MLIRLFYLIVLIFLVLFAPWWLSVVFGLAGIWHYRNFYEIIIPALLFDFLYNAAGVTIIALPLGFTVLSLVFIYLLEELKEMVMFNTSLS